jgi:hypothetical protein
VENGDREYLDTRPVRGGYDVTKMKMEAKMTTVTASKRIVAITSETARRDRRARP